MGSSIDEQVLRATKEIVVKFIEVGRVSPTSFSESFKDIYTTIDDAVKGRGMNLQRINSRGSAKTHHSACALKGQAQGVAP